MLPIPKLVSMVSDEAEMSVMPIPGMTDRVHVEGHALNDTIGFDSKPHLERYNSEYMRNGERRWTRGDYVG
jgi:hypothetical protein